MDTNWMAACSGKPPCMAAEYSLCIPAIMAINSSGAPQGSGGSSSESGIIKFLLIIDLLRIQRIRFVPGMPVLDLRPVPVAQEGDALHPRAGTPGMTVGRTAKMVASALRARLRRAVGENAHGDNRPAFLLSQVIHHSATIPGRKPRRNAYCRRERAACRSGSRTRSPGRP